MKLDEQSIRSSAGVLVRQGSNAATALHLIAWQVTQLLQTIKKIRITNNDATTTVRADVRQTAVSVDD